MSELYMCQGCRDTYFVYEGEEAACSRCKSKLILACEWCGSANDACACGKDEIDVE